MDKISSFQLACIFIMFCTGYVNLATVPPREDTVLDSDEFGELLVGVSYLKCAKETKGAVIGHDFYRFCVDSNNSEKVMDKEQIYYKCRGYLSGIDTQGRDEEQKILTRVSTDESNKLCSYVGEHIIVDRRVHCTCTDVNVINKCQTFSAYCASKT